MVAVDASPTLVLYRVEHVRSSTNNCLVGIWLSLTPFWNIGIHAVFSGLLLFFRFIGTMRQFRPLHCPIYNTSISIFVHNANIDFVMCDLFYKLNNTCNMFSWSYCIGHLNFLTFLFPSNVLSGTDSNVEFFSCVRGKILRFTDD